MRKLAQLLKAEDLMQQPLLDQLWSKLGERPNISWYPSSGNDYRDIMELKSNRVVENGIGEQPALFIHTDYNPKWVNFENPLYKDERTIVSAKIEIPLRFVSTVNYEVSPSVPFHRDAFEKPAAIYLRVEIESHRLGNIEADLIYFFFENKNFLSDVLLKHDIPISHFVNIREGIGFGGGDGTALLVDHVNACMQLHQKYILTNETGFGCADYGYTATSRIEGWSGLSAAVYMSA